MKNSVVKAVLTCVTMMLGTTAVHAESMLDLVKKSETLNVGWGEWKPFEYKDVISGELKGIMIDLAGELAKRLDVKAEFVLDAWPTLPAGIAAGRFNVALMGYSDGRAQVVDYSRPLYTSDFTAMVAKSSGITTWDELNVPGNTIAVTTGSSTDEVLAKLTEEGKIKAEVQRIRDVGAGVLAVSSGNVQAYVNQRDSLSLMVAAQPQMALVDGSFGKAWFGVVYPKGDKEFGAAIDAAIDGMIADNYIAGKIAEYEVKGAVQAE